MQYSSAGVQCVSAVPECTAPYRRTSAQGTEIDTFTSPIVEIDKFAEKTRRMCSRKTRLHLSKAVARPEADGAQAGDGPGAGAALRVRVGVRLTHQLAVNLVSQLHAAHAVLHDLTQQSFRLRLALGSHVLADVLNTVDITLHCTACIMTWIDLYFGNVL